MQDQIDQLTNRVATLENMLKGRSTSFENHINNAVFFDEDPKGINVPIVSVVNFTPKTTTNLTIATYLRLRFRGQVYNVPVLAIS